MNSPTISQFIDRHFRHFNAATLKDAAQAYRSHLERGGKMLVTLAGAMSTAELGLSLAEMIRRDKVHGICCTGANLEEDLFNLVAQKHYERIPRYRELTAQDEQRLLERHLNRVTDTCIPEAEAMRRIEAAVAKEWLSADQAGLRMFPHEFLYRLLRSGALKSFIRLIRSTAGCARRRSATCRSTCQGGRIPRSAICMRRSAWSAPSNRCTRCEAASNI